MRSPRNLCAVCNGLYHIQRSYFAYIANKSLHDKNILPTSLLFVLEKLF